MTQPRRALFHAPLDSGVEQAECVLGDKCDEEGHNAVLVAGSPGVLRFACPKHEEREYTADEVAEEAAIASETQRAVRFKKGDREGNGHGIGFVIYQPLSVWPPEAPVCSTCGETMRAVSG